MTDVTWDQVQEIFSGFDIAFMKMYGYELDDYDKVKVNAETLYGVLERPMPPWPIKPLSGEQKTLFRSWIDAGCPRAEGGPQAFIAMSQFLTGFDDESVTAGPGRAVGSNRALAEQYLARLTEWSSESESGVTAFLPNSDPREFTRLQAAWESGEESFAQQIETDAGLQAAARAVITLWLSANAVAAPGFGMKIQANGYPYARIWDIFQTHPMGYSTYAWRDKTNPKKAHQIQSDPPEDGVPYWTLEPSEYEGGDT